VKLGLASVRRLESHVRKTYEGTVFELTVTRGLLLADMIELSKIVVPDRKRGTGTAIMRELCAFADRNRVGIRLTPASKGDFAATTSRARLIRFYKRFGFVEEKARAGDCRPVPVMIRKCDGNRRGQSEAGSAVARGGQLTRSG
jgi:GNAT superfamily N-acetyltransferase